MALTDKQRSTLSGIYESLLGIIINRDLVEKYSLTTAVDEYLALLGGDSEATTYFGFETEFGPTQIDRLKAMREELDKLIDEVKED